MQVSIESPSALERRVTVVVEEQQIDQAVQQKLQRLSKTVKLKGFRTGKVPLNVVKQHYGPQVRQEVLQDVIQSSFYEAITQEQLNPAGMPNFEPKPSTPGKGLEYTATFEVYPQIALGDFSSLTIEKPQVEITDADLEQMLETIRKQHMTWSEVERAAQQGDKLKVDFAGTVDGEAFQGGSGSDMEVEIGKGRLIAGFEDGLVGLKVGDEKTLNLTFPDPYQNAELAGKPVQFAVTVKSVAEPTLPELNDEFAKKLEIADGSVEALRKEVRENMQRELNTNIESHVKKDVMDKLLELHAIDLPNALVQQEAQALARQMASNMQQQGMSADQANLPADIFEGEAKRRVGLGLIMAEIVKKQDIKADEAKVRAKIDIIAEPYEQKEQVVQWYYGDKRRKAEVESLVIEEQIVDWVLAQATVADKAMTFNEIMYPKGQK